MKKAYYYIIIIFVVLLIALGVLIYIDYKSKSSSDNNDILTKEGCLKEGGIWGAIGLDTIEECNLPTTDADKVCSDRGDCEGECVAELNADEARTVINTPVVKNGKCSQFRIVAGCHYFVNNGKVNGMLCVD